MIVGIDLGTTNSLVARIRQGRPELAPAENGSPLVPSFVSFPPGATEPLVGTPARDAREHFPESTIHSAKRFIGRGREDVAEWMQLLAFDFSASDSRVVRFKAGDKTLTPSEVAALVLKKLKAIGEQAFGETVSKAVITVPAYFNDTQRQATKLAGELAGLEVVRIVNEPTAACLAYGLDKKSLGTVAVFDMGGGTFDISILRVKDGVFEVLATNGDTALGGDDLDHAFVRALAPELTQAWGAEWESSPAARASILSAVEKAKTELSSAVSVSLEAAWKGKAFRRTVARSEFETWAAATLARLLGPCRGCLKDASITAAQITDVILVGGSTRVPAVRAWVESFFKREPICTLNPDEVVAMGAAVQANILAGQMGEMLLLDVIPLSLGIETMGGAVSKILHRNSTIPVSASQTFTTYVDGQVSVGIHVLQGEREMAGDNRSLARFDLKGIPPLPAGIPKIEVEFIIDANGILNVRALELRTGTRASVAVNPSFGLGDAEVERMLEAAYDHAEADFHARFLVEAQTEGDSLLRATAKSLSKAQHLTTPEQRQAIDAACGRLTEAMRGTDHKNIRKEIESLNEVTHPLAEQLLNEAVREALQNKTIPGGSGEMD
ncbi:Fe-S protein assembly chaperone HscA [bacterium]|nr:Fe-S protein assembly chaperone HscA [bacterium]